MALLGIDMQPDDSGSSPYSYVFGEQPFLSCIAVQTDSVEEVNKALQRLQCPYNIPRSRKVKQQINNMLSNSCVVAAGQSKNPSDAPYQGPFKVLLHRDQTFTLEIRGQPNTVSIERLNALCHRSHLGTRWNLWFTRMKTKINLKKENIKWQMAQTRTTSGKRIDVVGRV